MTVFIHHDAFTSVIELADQIAKGRRAQTDVPDIVQALMMHPASPLNRALARVSYDQRQAMLQLREKWQRRSAQNDGKRLLLPGLSGVTYQRTLALETVLLKTYRDHLITETGEFRPVTAADLIVTVFKEPTVDEVFRDSELARYTHIVNEELKIHQYEVGGSTAVASDSSTDKENHNRTERPTGGGSSKNAPLFNSESGGASGNSVLQELAIDLTKKAREGKIDPVIGRQREIARSIQILCKSKKNNPLLLGLPGVGKTAIAEGIALFIAANVGVPASLAGKRVLMLDVSAILANTSHRGEMEGRLRKILEECKREKVILFIDELHTLVGAGKIGDGGQDAGNILKPALQNGEVTVIGATTHDEYRKFFSKDAALKRRFQPVHVAPATTEQSIAILMGLREKLESHHGLLISDEVIHSAVELSHRYIADRVLPDKAIDALDEACSAIVCQGDKGAQVQVRDIETVVSEWSGVPIGHMRKSDKDKLQAFMQIMQERFVAQDLAKSTILRGLRIAAAGLKDPLRPDSYLFSGPSGSGKTLLAQLIHEAVFNDGFELTRLDMSEYMEKVSITRLIGAPPGYVGYEEGGTLTEAVRRRPYQVLLVDEIEKAHPAILDIFLQILDYGRVNDGMGTPVDFRHTILIFTTNAGTLQVEKMNPIGFHIPKEEKSEAVPNNVMESLEQSFRVEFLNRFSAIVPFHKLEAEHIRGVVDALIAQFQKNLLGPKRITLSLSEAAKDLIWQRGISAKFGARQVHRAIANLLKAPLSDLILDGTLTEGMVVAIDLARTGDEAELSFVPLGD